MFAVPTIFSSLLEFFDDNWDEGYINLRVSVSAGETYSMVLSECGDVYSFGYGEYGQLGHGDAENQLVPRVVSALEGVRCVSVSAGGHHPLVLSESGDA